MAFKMNKPSMIKGSKAHKKALQELNVNRTGYENLPDGRSKSSAFQQRELTPEEMQAQLDAADKMQVNVAADKYFTTDLGELQDTVSGGKATKYETSSLDYTNEDGTIDEQKLYDNYHHIIKDLRHRTGPRFSEEERQKARDEMKMLDEQFGYTPDKYGQRTPGYYDPEKLQNFIFQYNNYVKVKPYMEEGYSFQDHQQKLAEAKQEREAGEYNRKLAIDLVRRGDYDTMEDAMNAINKG